MSSFPDAWAAVRGRPWLFLASWWPWRSLAYLLTAVPLGLVTCLVLLLMLLVGVTSSMFVVGLFVLARIPTVTAAVAVLERVRLRLVLPRDGDAAPSLRDRLRAGRGLPVAWSEIGHAVLLGALLWLVDATVLLFAVAVPGVLLLAPWLVTYDVIGIFGWQIDSPDEAWFAALGPGVVAAVAAAYLVTALASGQAALTRLLLDPPEARLVEAVVDLRRSRVDLVDAFESERRRIERDLHDGVQQRLVALTMTLGRAELDVPDGTGLELVQEARRQAEGALEDLRFTVRGIHPRVLTDHGLPAAVHDIADRSPVPVDVDIALDDRLPSPVEAAAYFVVSEALTNVVRHSRARSAQVHGWLEPGRLVLTVTDNGVGGADVTRGSGLAGLALRMEALDGEFDVHSPPGGPTEVRMACPVP